MKLVNDRVFERSSRIDRSLAVDRELHHQAAPQELAAGTPGAAARERTSVRVVEDQGRIVAVAIALGAVDPVAVAKDLGQAVDPHMPVIACAVRRSGQAGSRHK